MAPRLAAFGMAEDEMSFICVFSLHHGRYGRSACPRLQGEDVADCKARWSQHRLCCLAQGSLPVRAASLTRRPGRAGFTRDELCQRVLFSP